MTGPSSVIESIAMGRDAAMQIHMYLGGVEKDIQLPLEKPIAYVVETEDFYKKRMSIPMRENAVSRTSFDEVELSLDKNNGRLRFFSR